MLAELDELEVERKLGQFFAQQQEENITINIDGKVLRGTIPTGKTQGTHLLAAYVPETGVVLIQIEVESKANEIVAAPQLLDYLDLTGCVVTGDAMFTQGELCIQIMEAGGHFVFPVKYIMSVMSLFTRMTVKFDILSGNDYSQPLTIL